MLYLLCVFTVYSEGILKKMYKHIATKTKSSSDAVSCGNMNIIPVYLG